MFENTPNMNFTQWYVISVAGIFGSILFFRIGAISRVRVVGRF